MPKTYIERDTASGLTNTGGDTETTKFVKIIDLLTAASVSIAYTVAKSATERLKWITASGEPNQLTWAGGTYTWKFEVLTANANLSIIEVILRRLSSDGVTVRASKSSGAIAVGLGTTGVKTGTILWSDGTQNPAGSLQADRLEVVFRVQNADTMAADSGAVGTNTVNNQLQTPLAALFTRAISETITVSGSLSRIATKLRSITQTTSIAETLARAFVKPRSITQTVVIGEAISRFKKAIRTITETAAISETLVRRKAAFRSLTEIIPIAGSLSRVATKVRALATQTVSISETLSRTKSAFRTITETNSISESLSRLATKIRAIAAQTVAITESLVRVKIQVAVTELVGGRPLTKEEERILFKKPQIVTQTFAKISKIKLLVSKPFEHRSNIALFRRTPFQYLKAIEVDRKKHLDCLGSIDLHKVESFSKDTEIIILVNKKWSYQRSTPVKVSSIFHQETKPIEVIKDSEFQEIVKLVEVVDVIRRRKL